ncbi:kinase-like domain-containing protein [Suillus ampliporus]|nr:kinase-like domain-containing protein [Suillus ampliporus]
MPSGSITPAEPPVIPRDQLFEVKEIPAAVGGYGQVFQCIMRPEAAPEVLVAVKVLMHLSGDVSKKRPYREMKLWMEARHKNIVPMLGITYGFSGTGFAMVSPWMKGGTLAQYLKDNKENMSCRKKMTLVRKSWYNHTACPNILQMKDIATGLAYLHSRHIVHGDLTTKNIMLDDSGRALLIDFGLSNVLEGMVGSYLSLSAARPGAVRFAAPELLGVEEATSQPIGKDSPVHDQLADMRSDIYSLGCVMLNVLTEQEPWYDYHGAWVIIGAIHRKKPLPIPDHRHLSEKRKQFICNCTSVRVTGRPSIQDAVVFIKEELRIEDATAPVQQLEAEISSQDASVLVDEGRNTYAPGQDAVVELHTEDAPAPIPQSEAEVNLDASALVDKERNTDAPGHCASASIQELKPYASRQCAPSPVKNKSNIEQPGPDAAKPSRKYTIVVVGAIGSGKSSLVNLLSGTPVARTSNDAGRCTSKWKDYPVSFRDTVYRVFDSVGFACSNGTPRGPKEWLEKNFREATLNDYGKIQDELRGRRVPVVLVVTHFEEPFTIKSWWSKTSSTFRTQLNAIANHICITSIHDKYLDESREHIFQMIMHHCTSKQGSRGSRR